MILKKNKEKRLIVFSKDQLVRLIEKTIEREGPNCDLNFLDISRITDLSYLFSYIYLSDFNGDISKWNTENVTDMSYMFAHSKFSGDLSKWNVKNVKHMPYMFYNSPLDKNPPKWVYYDTEEM